MSNSVGGLYETRCFDLPCTAQAVARHPRDPNDTSDSDHVRAKTVVTSISRISERPTGKEACLVVIYGLELGRKYKITVLRDPDAAVSKRLGVDQLPSTIILNKQGKVSANVNGIDPAVDLAKQLAERLDAVLKG